MIGPLSGRLADAPAGGGMGLRGCRNVGAAISRA
jgi:hypothetical protein